MPRGKAGPSGTKAQKMGPEFPPGQILTDVVKKSWRLGKAIGRGGFGIIYLASDDVTATSDDKHRYVIKMEPTGNGPLFCEMYFYQRACKPEMIDEWKQRHRLEYLGIPKFHGTGQNSTHRFLVIPRCGPDLQKLISKAGGVLPPEEVFSIGVRMIDCLEYIHSKGYVHADVKASNILLGWRNQEILYNEVYLMDYGLAYRFLVDDTHADYKEDPKRKHDGTIEFCSRDSHVGARPSRRGDLETLGFCMLQWLMGTLPWEQYINNKNKVSEEKDRYMSNLKLLKQEDFKEKDAMIAYLEGVKKLGYADDPNYQRFRSLLSDRLRKLGTADKNLNLAHYGDSDGKGQKRKWQLSSSDPSSSKKLASAGGRARSATPKGKGRKATPKRRAASPAFDESDAPAKKKPVAAAAASGRSRKKSPATPRANSKVKVSGADIIPGAAAMKPSSAAKSGAAATKSKSAPKSGADIIPGAAAMKSKSAPKSGADIIPGATRNPPHASRSGADIIPGQDQREAASAAPRSKNPADVIPGAPNGSVGGSSACGRAAGQTSTRRTRRRNDVDVSDTAVQTSPVGTGSRR